MKKFSVFLFVGLLLFGMVGTGNALTLQTVTGTWDNVIGGVGVNGVGTNEIRWGTPTVASYQSGLSFDGSAPPNNIFDIGDAFDVGVLTHFNYPIVGGTAATGADLTIGLAFSDPAGLNGLFDFTFTINETPNTATPPSNPLNNDIIGWSTGYANETFAIGGIDYTLQLLGFGSDAAHLIDYFSSPETGAPNSATLWARVTTPAAPVPEPATMLLLGTGLVGLAGVGRKKFLKKS